MASEKITLPCGHAIDECDLLSLAAGVVSRRRGDRVGGRPKIAKRCPCGKYSRALATQRGHKCEAPLTALPR
jgi:hypothetical protein